MTTILPVNKDSMENVTVDIKAPYGDETRSFVVPLDRFTIYRSGFLTDAVIQALRQRANDGKHDEPIRVAFNFPHGADFKDSARLMNAMGLIDTVSNTEPYLVGMHHLAVVSRMWNALVALEARHAVDQCDSFLRTTVALDDPTAILTLYMYDTLRSRSNVCCARNKSENVISALFPMMASAGSALSDNADVTKYMTLGKRLLECAMNIRSRIGEKNASRVLGQERTDGAAADVTTILGIELSKHGVTMRNIVAEALRDWSLPLHAIDQVFGTEFSLCRVMPSCDESTWLMGSMGCIASFEDTIKKVCPAFAPSLIGADGVLSSDSVVMAGGAVVNAMHKRTSQHWLNGSDIDLWIVGEDHGARVAAFTRVVDRLFADVPECHATITGSVVTFWPPSLPAHESSASLSVPVQVIFTPYRSASQVVCNFDMTHACAYYDGSDVYATRACASSLVTRIARSTPGTRPKTDRLFKAIDKGFFLGAAETARLRAQRNQARIVDADKEPIVTGPPSNVAAADAVDSESKTEAPNTERYHTSSALVKAFAFVPLAGNDYRVWDDCDGTVQAPNATHRACVQMSKRFAVAMPLMDMFFDASRNRSGQFTRDLGMRLLDIKTVGPVVGQHACSAMRDCAEARGSCIAQMLASMDTLTDPKHRLASSSMRTELMGMLCEAKGFEKDGRAFVKTPQVLEGRIFDGITGAPMTFDQIDAERHVFSATLTTVAGSMTCGAYVSTRVERLRVYPRSFVAAAARVLASTSIIAADGFVASKPTCAAGSRV